MYEQIKTFQALTMNYFGAYIIRLQVSKAPNGLKMLLEYLMEAKHYIYITFYQFSKMNRYIFSNVRTGTPSYYTSPPTL
jgi:hypothetical protein